jgi:hypothetical protein
MLRRGTTMRCMLILITWTLRLGLAGVDVDDPVQLKRRIAELESRNQDLLAHAVLFRTLVDCKVHMEFPADSSLRPVVSDALAQVLNIDDDQLSALNSASVQARHELAQIIADQHPAVVASDSGVSFVIEDFTAAGHAIEERLNRSVTSLLGPERASFALDQMASNRSLYAFFGEGRQSISIHRAANGVWTIAIIRSPRTGAGDSSTFRLGDGEILARFELLMPFIPSDWTTAAHTAAASLPNHQKAAALGNAGDF